MQEVMAVLVEGLKNRATSATLMNAVSSRSHGLLIVYVTQRDTTTGRIRKAKLCECPVTCVSRELSRWLRRCRM
jgi:hypothetical protein